MRNSNEISAELEAKMAQTPASEAERATLASEINGLTNELRDAQIDEAARRALANQRTFSPEEKKDLKRFSFAKFIRQAADGQLDGIEAEMNAEGAKEAREAVGKAGRGYFIPSSLLRDYSYINATETGYGDKFKQTTVLTFAEAIHNAMLGSKLGVRYLDGLQGNFGVVKGGAATASWYSEEAAAATQKIGYGLATMSPKRLQAIAGYTYDLLAQTSLAADTLIYNELVNSVAAALDAAIFNGTGTSGQPTGIRNADGVNTVAIGTNGGAMTYANLVKMETEVAAQNGLFGRLAYVTNSKVYGAMKTIPQVSGYPVFLAADGKANGYDIMVSNAIPSNLTKGSASACSSMIFGNFEEVLVGGWAGLNLIIDPFKAKEKGVVEVSVGSYHDVLVRRPKCFAKCEDITTE